MMRPFRFFLLSAVVLSLAVSCVDDAIPFTEGEIALIGGAEDGVMRVLTVDDPQDSLVLRTPCEDISVRDIGSELYKVIARRMTETVTSPEQDGVGIAGPQVGLLRRIIAVQRFDKPGEPFEVYPNIYITATYGNPEPGPEGCLSVPGRRGEVERWRNIDIRYTSPSTLKDTTESVHGFTAVIFQHECDHLDGILYTDYLP